MGGKKPKITKPNDDVTRKGNELKALEVYVAKSNVTKNTAYFPMLSGNEETAQIYAYVASTPVRQAYRELIKFRRRAAFFEYLVQLLHKAINDDAAQLDINEWCESGQGRGANRTQMFTLILK